MLNTHSDLEAAIGLEANAGACMPFGEGICLRSGAVRPTQPRKGSLVYPRPRAFWATDVAGQRRMAAGLAAAALGQPNASKQYPHTTRVAASGGTKGPHPAREPEPA